VRNLHKDIEQFVTVLFKTHPELKYSTNYSLSTTTIPFLLPESGRLIPNYETLSMTLNFPSCYRNQVLTISKFCGINFEHEFYDNLDMVTLETTFR
jgi:hypothetical protein